MAHKPSFVGSRPRLQQLRVGACSSQSEKTSYHEHSGISSSPGQDYNGKGDGMQFVD